jgi:hypothetical protein
MKTTQRSILVLTLVLLAMIIPAAAQNNEEIEKKLEANIDLPAQEKRAPSGLRQISERVPIGAPAIACPLGMQQTITAGLADNLAAPFEAAFKSPLLLAAYPTPTYTYSNFDDPAVNRLFGYSFMLRNYKPCEGRFCSANLAIRVCNSGRDLWSNDKIYIGSMESGRLNTWVAYGDIWSGSEAKKCKDLNYTINGATLSTKQSLDVLMQDDSTIDHLKLTLNY